MTAPCYSALTLRFLDVPAMLAQVSTSIHWLTTTSNTFITGYPRLISWISNNFRSPFHSCMSLHNGLVYTQYRHLIFALTPRATSVCMTTKPFRLSSSDPDPKKLKSILLSGISSLFHTYTASPDRRRSVPRGPQWHKSTALLFLYSIRPSTALVAYDHLSVC